MPHEGHFPESPADWLRYAYSDLELARVKRPSQEIENAASLTDYAVVSRYPGDFEPVHEEEYKETVRLAQTVVL